MSERKKRNLLANLGVQKDGPGDQSEQSPSETPAAPATRRRKTTAERDKPGLEALDGGKSEAAVMTPVEPPSEPVAEPPTPAKAKPVAVQAGAKVRLGFYVDGETADQFREMVQMLAHQFPGPSEAGENAIELWIKHYKKDFERLKEVLGDQPVKRFKPGRRSG